MIGYLIIAGIGYGIAFWISSRGLAWWISVVGFFLALIIGWLGGGLIVAGGLSLISPDAAKDVIVALLGRGFWWAAAGAGFGVFQARLKQKKTVSASPVDESKFKLLKQEGSPGEVNKQVTVPSMQPSAPIHTSSLSQAPSHAVGKQIVGMSVHESAVHTQSVDQTQSPTSMPLSASTEEDFWAAAMAEAETGQRRPGVWAKAFAECDGDETKAKVAYLKARVQQLTVAEMAQREQTEREGAERERSVLIEQERLKVQAEQQMLVTQAVTKFESGKPPTIEELAFLTDAAESNPSIAQVSDRLHNNTLLHWCARLQLDRLAAALVRLDADASALNDEGQQAHQLARGVALKSMLTSAADRPKGTCPNCSTVMPLTSQGCAKCGAVFGADMAFNLVPVK